MKHLLLLLCVLFCAAAQGGQPLVDSVDALLTPAYQRWTDTTQRYADAVTSSCRQGDWPPSQQRWRENRQLWSQLSALPVGPLVENNIAMQVQFWPDKKNLVGFQVEGFLKAPPATIDLNKVSVVLRGLSASEYILFDDAIDLDDSAQRQKYCPLLLANAAYQNALAQQLLPQWRAYLDRQRQPTGQANGDLMLVTELLRAEVTALETLHKKLALALGTSAPQPFQAEHWRSDYSLPALREGFSVHRQLWQQLWRPTLIDTDAGLARRSDEQFEQAAAAFARQPDSLAAALQQPEALAQLRQLEENLKQLQLLFNTDIANALGVQIGFNANDGD